MTDLRNSVAQDFPLRFSVSETFLPLYQVVSNLTAILGNKSVSLFRMTPHYCES